MSFYNFDHSSGQSYKKWAIFLTMGIIRSDNFFTTFSLVRYLYHKETWLTGIQTISREGIHEQLLGK